MKRLAALLLMLLPLTAEGQTIGPSCTVAWDAVTQSVGNPPIPLTSPIGSYRIYFTNTATTPPTPGVTPPAAIAANGSSPPPLAWASPTCFGLADGPHVVWVTAVNINGESAPSTPAGFTYAAVPPPPPAAAPKPVAPSNVRIGP